MSRSRHTLDWISPDIAALTLSAGASWTDCLNAFEQLSEANLAGRPVNYLLQLSGPVSFACGPDGDNLADFFLDFIPARTALALVRPASPTPGPRLQQSHAVSRIGFVQLRIVWLHA